MKSTHCSFGRRPRLFILCLLAVTASGCIEGRYEIYVRYEKGKDSFSYLCMFTDIRIPASTLPPDYSAGRARLFPLFRRPAMPAPADDPRERNYFFALSQLKDDLLIMPVPATTVGGIFGAPRAYVRRGDRMVHPVNLSQYPTGFWDKLALPEPVQAQVDITGITI